MDVCWLVGLTGAAQHTDVRFLGHFIGEVHDVIERKVFCCFWGEKNGDESSKHGQNWLESCKKPKVVLTKIEHSRMEKIVE